MDEQEYIKPKDAAKRLGVSRAAIYKWITEGKLKAVRFGANAVRIHRSELEAFERRAGLDQGAYNPEDIALPMSAAA